MKEKMLTKLERDRAVGQVAGLQSTLKNMEGLRVGSGGTKLGQCKSFRKLCYCFITSRVSGRGYRNGPVRVSVCLLALSRLNCLT